MVSRALIVAALLVPSVANASKWLEPQFVVDDVVIDTTVTPTKNAVVVGTEHWLPDGVGVGDHVVVRARVAKVKELVSAWKGHNLGFVGQADSIVYVAVDRKRAVHGGHLDVLLRPSPIYGTKLGFDGVSIATTVVDAGDLVRGASGVVQAQAADANGPDRLRLDLTCTRWEVGTLESGPRDEITIAAIFKRAPGAPAQLDTAAPRSDYIYVSGTIAGKPVSSLHARGQLRSDGALGGAFRGDLALEVLPSPDLDNGDAHVRIHVVVAADGAVTELTTTQLPQ